MAALSAAIMTLSATFAAATDGRADDVERRTANNGQLVMENVPPIPATVVDELNRFQATRSASFRAWAGNGEGLYVTTRFDDVNQLHRVDFPGGARRQLTFSPEPVGDVAVQPGGRALVFTRDAGGSEFSQIFLFDERDGAARMLSDGESRNSALKWDRQGHRLAWQSTARNGASNDIWIMDPAEPDGARVVLESPDGTWWGPADFTAAGSRMLVANYVSITDSRAYLLDLDTGRQSLLTRGGVNYPVGFDRRDEGFWLVTDRDSEFAQLAWQSLEPGSEPEIVTGDIGWNVSEATLSHDRRRLAFSVNEGGLSRVYLMDTATRRYRSVNGVPTGVAYDLAFSPDDKRLAMTLNTPQTPSDTFVLELGRAPTDHGRLERWTFSEVGGLDTEKFRIPERFDYPTFDTVDGVARRIPAWIYRPEGEGPYPVVVSIHGGPEGQSRPFFSDTYQMWLRTLGVAVILPNVRGSNGYGKTWLGLDNGMRREDSVRDIGALLDWIADQPDLDASRVAVFGGSYGGYMVLASAVHYSERLRAAVDVVGISNFVTFLENTQDYRRDLRRVEYGDERDPAMRAYLEKISPVNNVEKINVPLFIVQGNNDPRVPVTESGQMVEALRGRGNPVWYMNALNEGHGYRKKENRDIYQQAVVQFLRRHLVGEDASTVSAR